jgi:hypothetical protein
LTVDIGLLIQRGVRCGQLRLHLGNSKNVAGATRKSLETALKVSLATMGAKEFTLNEKRNFLEEG